MPIKPWRYALPDDATPPTDADRLLLWIVRRQWRTVAAGAAFGIPWMLSIALVPAAIGKAIDDGLVARDGRALLLWAGVIFGMGLLSAATTNLRHWFAVSNWLFAAFRAAIVTERAVRRAGPALTRDKPAGEVLTAFANDFWKLGMVFDVSARFAGAIVSFIVVSIILLQGSLLLGLVMLIGGPLLLASLSFVMRPLQKRQAAQREESGQLTALGADTVTGLRVLRGVGGEENFLHRYAAQSGRVRDAGVRLSGVQALLDAAQVLLPGLFVVVVTGLGAHLAVAGEISPGQLVAFYGYTAFLTMPLRTATEFVNKLITSRVMAGRLVSILAAQPDHPQTTQRVQLGTNGGARELVDPISGVRIEQGRLTAIVSARPEETAEIAARLGRTVPGRHGVTWGDLAIDDLPIDDVRRSIVVSQSDPHLFSGPVRRELGADSTPGADDDALLAALHTADASDAVDSIDGGLDGELEERGRSLSGGQRQRLALARALLRDPEVLVLVEPTSAVDAHTEARIAERIPKHRNGSTTVVVTASPLLLDRADTVLVVEDGVVTTHGTHHDLVRNNPAYRRIVLRGEDD
ncbi:putative ABC transporter transmembrane protein [Janibacter sp. HTCC2649]|uniref:ABC transporter transmembrane domain-containing protein n=1 Tax=Janibacter sp. HTCC2649 TaxID=313589 RepID=UPI0000670E3F|nr:ABC transporter ATP-binding protein [Janibacter sp. HTCC2649]EAP97304.1 putative ABC transporter transmembrane protein [Janibacter sp. HTCC2649]